MVACGVVEAELGKSLASRLLIDVTDRAKTSLLVAPITSAAGKVQPSHGYNDFAMAFIKLIQI
jgi:hypothetical protein